MGEPGWGDDVPVFRPGDVEAARGLTGLAKMVHDHGLPVARRAADSNGRVVVYTFTDGTTYMEPVEPPSEQYINSAAVMVPGGIALSRGKGLAGAARAIAAEAIDDAATSRASQAANVVTGGYLKWIPAPIASILFGGKPKPRVSGVVDDAADAAKDAGKLATKVDHPRGASTPASGLPDQLPATRPDGTIDPAFNNSAKQAFPDNKIQSATQRLAGQIDEVGRRRSLGTDPTGQWRAAEEQAALRLEKRVGQLTRDPSKAGDWIDKNGNVYDAVGPVPGRHFDLGSFTRQIDKHLLKQGIDKIVVDLAGLSGAVRAEVINYISGLSDAQKAKLIIQF
jgi:hypothetical protein